MQLKLTKVKKIGKEDKIYYDYYLSQEGVKNSAVLIRLCFTDKLSTYKFNQMVGNFVDKTKD